VTTTDAVIAELRRRHAAGLETYGVPLEQSALDRRQMLQMAKEEALDLACYLQRLIDMDGDADQLRGEIARLRQELDDTRARYDRDVAYLRT